MRSTLIVNLLCSEFTSWSIFVGEFCFVAGIAFVASGKGMEVVDGLLCPALLGRWAARLVIAAAL